MFKTLALSSSDAQNHVRIQRLRECRTVESLVENGFLTDDQGCGLTPSQEEAFESQKIREMIARNDITIEQILRFEGDLLEVFSGEVVQSFITEKMLSVERLLGIRKRLQDTFKSLIIYELISKKILTIDQVLAFNWYHQSTFESVTIRRLIFENVLTVAQVVAFKHHHKEAFESEIIRKLISEKVLTVNQIMGFEPYHLAAFTSQHIRHYISDGTLTNEQLLRFKWHHEADFSSNVIRQLMSDKILTVEEILGFKEYHRQAFNSKTIQGHLTARTLTVQEVLGFSSFHLPAFNSQMIRAHLAVGTLTVEQILRCEYWHIVSFELGAIVALLNDKILTVRQVLAFRGLYHPLAFLNPAVRALITANTITADQLVLLSENQINALTLPGTMARLATGVLTFEDFLDEQRGAHVLINEEQSTHNAAVHQSVSVSATKLQERYGAEIEGTGLDVITNRVSTYLEGLDDSRVNAAAKRGMQRITAPDYVFEDPGSGVSIRALLALSFLAIEDAGQRMGTLEDARAQFVHGLYEIQRGYNLNSKNQDNKEADRCICTAGTFNKLIEKLEGVHPDCNIRFMTQETAALKLPIVVQEEAVRYLSGLANPKSHADFLAFTRLMSELEEEGAGADAIYEDIKDSVSQRMYEEFGSLYRGQNDEIFTGLIHAGEDTELKNLNQFQAQLEDSEGYRLYCSEMLFPERRFLPAYRRCEQPDTISSEVQPSSQESIMSRMRP